MLKQVILAFALASTAFGIDYSGCDKGLCFGIPAGCVETEVKMFASLTNKQHIYSDVFLRNVMCLFTSPRMEVYSTSTSLPTGLALLTKDNGLVLPWD